MHWLIRSKWIPGNRCGAFDGASSRTERWFIRRGSRAGRSARVIIIRQPIKIAAVLAFNINFKLITCIFVSRSDRDSGKIGRYVLDHCTARDRSTNVPYRIDQCFPTVIDERCCANHIHSTLDHDRATEPIAMRTYHSQILMDLKLYIVQR